jgi:TRAP transporter TAXI family solute receptor
MSTTTRLSALLVCTLLAGCGSSDEDPDPKPGPKPAPTKSAGADLDKLKDSKAEEVVLDGRSVVLAGSPGGATYELARGMTHEGKAVAVVRTRGSLETLHLLAWGAGDAGFVQADVLMDPRQRVLRGSVTFGAALYNEEVHVVVASGSEAKSLLDLAGKKVGVGNPGSGGATTAENLMWAAGAFDVELVFGATLDSLSSGDVAALVMVGGQPIASLLGRNDVKVMDLGDSLDALLAKLETVNPHYTSANVDKAHGGPAKTVAVPSLLVYRQGFEGELAPASACAHPKGKEAKGYDGQAAKDNNASIDGPSFVLRDPKASLRLAGGQEAGYAQAASALKRAWEAGDANIVLVDTRGSLQNLALVSAGQAELAIVQEDVLLEAATRPQTARLLARVRVVAPLFSQSIHLVQKEGGALSDAASWRGQDLTLGAAGSGLWVSARRLLRQKRVLPEHYTGHLSGPSKAGFRFRHGDPESGEVALNLGEAAGYTAAEGGGVHTRALLVCRTDLPADQVAALTAAVYAHRKNLGSADERLSQLDPDALAAPEGCKLHAGSTQAKEAGLEADSADPWN